MVDKQSIEEPDDDYDIVPHKRLIELEKEVDVIKKNPFGATPSGKEMLDGMSSLGKGIKELVSLFRDASEEMKKEQEDISSFDKQMGPVMEKLNDLIEQNKKIARGVIAVADMLKEYDEKVQRISRGGMSGMPFGAGMTELPPGPEAPMRQIRPLPPEEIPLPSDFPPPTSGSLGYGRIPVEKGPEGWGRMPPPKLMGMSRPMPPSGGPIPSSQSTESMLMTPVQKKQERQGFFR